jgi:hypothetical protein
MKLMLRLLSIVVAIVFAFVCASSQDSAVAGQNVPMPYNDVDSTLHITHDQDVEAVENSDSQGLTATHQQDSSSAEREAESYQQLSNQLFFARYSHEVPLLSPAHVDNISPKYRQELYDRYSRTSSIIPALVNFFPIPFLGTIILGDSYGGYLIGGAALLAFIAIPGKVSQCTECQLPADIMLYGALFLGAWAAFRPFYLYQKNRKYNQQLASMLRPPEFSFLSLTPILQPSIAGVVVPAMQLTIGF